MLAPYLSPYPFQCLLPTFRPILPCPLSSCFRGDAFISWAMASELCATREAGLALGQVRIMCRKRFVEKMRCNARRAASEVCEGLAQDFQFLGRRLQECLEMQDLSHMGWV